MRPVQTFIIEGRVLGAAPRDLKRIADIMMIPLSHAYLCPACGEVWARCPVVADGGQMSSFKPILHPCRKCTDLGPNFTGSGGVPGSIMLDYDHAFNGALPDGVIRWEFERHLATLESSQ